MKEIHVRFTDGQLKYLDGESEKKGISRSEYIRLLLQSSMKDSSLVNEASGRLWLYGLPLRERKRMLERAVREKKKTGVLEPYVEGILEKNPHANTEQICRAMMKTFDVPITAKLIKMIRRVKERFRKRRKISG